MPRLLETKNLCRDFARPATLRLPWQPKPAPLRVLHDINVHVNSGEIVGFVGESGSGKTTLARHFNRLLDPTAGSVVAHGADISRYRSAELARHRRRVQMVFQNADAALHPFMRVGEILREAIALSGAEISSDELLESVGLPASVADLRPASLSGGQKRRVGIARVLATMPEVILADEPLAGLDTIVGFRVLKLIYELVRSQGLAMVYITHDLEVAAQICDRIYVMFGGRVVDQGPGSILLRADGGHPYVKELVENTIGIKEQGRGATDPASTRIQPITTTNETDSSAGCVWHPRCVLYRELGGPERCRRELPAWKQLPGDRLVACHFRGECTAHEDAKAC